MWIVRLCGSLSILQRSRPVVWKAPSGLSLWSYKLRLGQKDPEFQNNPELDAALKRKEEAPNALDDTVLSLWLYIQVQ